MKKIFKNNKGFTLVELLAVIAILSVVITITMYIAINVVAKAKEKSYQVTIHNIEKEAGNYLTEKGEGFFLDSDANLEYQCVTVQNLIDYGYLRDDVTNSPVSSDMYVGKNNYIYIERDVNTKAVVKSVYIKDADSAYTKYCNFLSLSDGDITYQLNPKKTVYARVKMLTINYNVHNTNEVNIGSKFAYNHIYRPDDENDLQEQMQSDKGKVKVTSILSDGKSIDSITALEDGSSIANSIFVVTNIDKVGPVVALANNDKKRVSKKVTIPLVVTDDKSGVNTSSFTKSDLTVTIGGEAAGKITLTYVGSGEGNLTNNYNLTITDSNLSGPVVIVVKKDGISDRVVDSIKNMNDETTLRPDIIFDNVAPVATLEATNKVKETNQEVTIGCSDESGEASYYFGTTKPTTNTKYTKITANEKRTISASGTYYLYCKDEAGNISDEKKAEYLAYKVDNRLLTTDGTYNNYTKNDYSTFGSVISYIALKDTTLAMTDIYTLPEGSNSNRFAGASVGAASTSVATVSVDNQVLSEDNKIYTMWFNRNILNIRYKPNGGTVTAETTNTNGTVSNWSVDGNGYINRNGHVLLSQYRYGASKMDLPHPRYKYYLYVVKPGYTTNVNEEWICDSGCNDANKVFTQDEVYDANFSEMTSCDLVHGDCSIALNVNWVKATYTITLDNDEATTAGTEKIYEKYYTGVYLDSNLTKKMTASANRIQKPAKTGYIFSGYYDGDTQMINADGYKTDNFTTTTFTKDSTLIAKWKLLTYKVYYDGNGNTGQTYDDSSQCNSSSECGLDRYASGSVVDGNVFKHARVWDNTKEYNLVKNKFVKAGYEFAGWSTSRTGSVVYTDYQSVSGLSSTDGATVTLYARWQPAKYTITYKQGNLGATADGLTTFDMVTECTYGESCTLKTYSQLGGTFPHSTIESGDCDYTWSFAGWSTSLDVTLIAYNNGATFIYDKTENMILYAIGKRINYFSRGLNPTEYEDAEKITQYWNPFGTKGVYLSKIVIPESKAIDGWNFIGYRAGSNAASSTVTYGSDKVGSVRTPGVTTCRYYRSVYLRPLTINYDANSGTGKTFNTLETQYYNNGYPSSNTNKGAKISTPTFVLANNGFSRTNYNFAGWGETKTSTDPYTEGYSYNGWTPEVTNTTTSKTMYAIWNDANVNYIVKHWTHNLGENKYTLNSTETKSGTSGSTVTLANLAKTISGFTYDGGYITGDSTKPTSGAVTTTTVLADGSRVINLYYRRNILYVTYDVNGGTLTPSSEHYTLDDTTVAYDGTTKFKRGVYGSKVGYVNNTTYEVNDDGLHNYNSSSGIFITKTGYVGVSGSEWNTKKDGSGTSYSQSNSTYDANGFGGADLSTGDKTIKLYVNWTAKKLNITFNCNGGTQVSGTNNKVTYTYGVRGQKFPDPAVCERTGYNGIKWTWESSGTLTGNYSWKSGVSDAWIDDNSTGNTSKTLYAQWEKKPIYIFFNANASDATISGKCARGAGSDKTCSKNDNGWASNEDGTAYQVIRIESDLWNYNNSNYMKITRSGYDAVSGSEWKTAGGTTFSQATTYTYDTLKKAATEKGTYYAIYLYVNWQKMVTVKFDKNYLESNLIPEDPVTGKVKYVGGTETCGSSGGSASQNNSTAIGGKEYAINVGINFYGVDTGGFYLKNMPKLTKGETYTVSYFVRNQSREPRTDYYHNAGMAQGGLAQDGLTVTNELKRVQYSFTATASTDSNQVFKIYRNKAQDAGYCYYAGFYIHSLQLMKGEPALHSSGKQVVGANLTLPVEPERDGYKFNGWWTLPTGGTEVTESTKVPDKNVTYYAQWINEASMTIPQSGADCSFNKKFYDEDLKKDVLTTCYGYRATVYYNKNCSSNGGPIKYIKWCRQASCSYGGKYYGKPETNQRIEGREFCTTNQFLQLQ